MPTPYAYGSYMVDLGLKVDGADMTDSDVVNVAGICHLAGTIKEIWLGVGKVLPTDTAVNVYKAASTNISLLTGGTAVDLDSGGTYTVNKGTKLTLTSSVGNLKVAAGDMLIATYTMTDITAGDDAAFCCTVIIEANTW
jgi:hypothetical protein